MPAAIPHRPSVGGRASHSAALSRFSPRLETDLQYLMWQIACRHCRRGGLNDQRRSGGGDGVETTPGSALGGLQRRLDA